MYSPLSKDILEKLRKMKQHVSEEILECFNLSEHKNADGSIDISLLLSKLLPTESTLERLSNKMKIPVENAKAKDIMVPRVNMVMADIHTSLEDLMELFKEHLYYELAMMQGSGINRRDRNNQKDLLGRLDFRPVENWRIVVTGQLGTGNAVAASKYNPSIQIGENYTRNRWSAGAEWKSHASYTRLPL